MHKKIKKYHAKILSHSNDNMLLFIMLAFTAGFGIFLYTAMP